MSEIERYTAHSNLTLEFSNTSEWVAQNRALTLDYTYRLYDCWSTDETEIKMAGKLLFYRKSPHAQYFVLDTGRAVVELDIQQRTISVGILAGSLKNAEVCMEEVRSLFPPSLPTKGVLEVTFWYNTSEGPKSYTRKLVAPSWSEIEENYPQEVRGKMFDLTRLEMGESNDRLLLWQGEPGTGKTYALRAMGQEWISWCKVHYVLDPERFLSEGKYLLSVILGTGDEGDKVPVAKNGNVEKGASWRLIVLEDAGEMIAKDAKKEVGQGLSRLLNLCDGLLGQGLRIMVLITTNEQIGSLHQAVSRPGRCLSKLVFSRFSSAEAREWLEKRMGKVALSPGSSTLAELYATLQGKDVGEVRGEVGFAEAAKV